METTASANSSAKASKILWTLLVISALWCLLALLGFPFPQTDDVYYIGAGINLANGGHLVNPMVEPLAPFYAYPPTQSYVIAGWLKLFGISAASFVSLYLLFCWITTVCLVRGFQILGRDLLGWMAALTFVVVSASVGVRADDCGFCFLAISFLLGVSRHASIRYWAPFFALLAVSAVPAAMAIAFPWIIYLVATYKHMWKAAFVGGAAMAVLLCAMVEWHLGAFLAGFLETSHRAGLGAGVWLMENWYRPMGALKSVYPVAVLAVLMGFSVLRRGFRLIDPLVILSLVLALYSMFVTVSGYRVMSLITVIAIGMYICILLPDSRWNRWLILANGLIIAVSLARPLLQGITEKQPSPAASAALLAKIEAAHPSRIFVDHWSFRYVYNYRIAPSMLALDWSSRPYAHNGIVTVKYPDECWVISPESVPIIGGFCPNGIPKPRYATMKGRDIGHWIANAEDLGVSLPGQ